MPLTSNGCKKVVIEMKQKKAISSIFGLSVLAVAMAGCGTTGNNVSTPHLDGVRESTEAFDRLHRDSLPDQHQKVEVFETFYSDRSAHARSEAEWLASVPFSMHVAEGEDLSLRQIMRVFASNGVNITNALDIEKFYYTGSSIVNTNARTALRVILGNMGLDYTVDRESRVVTISAMPRKSYYLSLNNRSTTYSSGSSGALSDAQSEAQGEETELGIVANNDFWVSLEEELDSRCTILRPDYEDPVLHGDYMPDDMLVGALQGWEDGGAQGGMGSGVSRGELDEYVEEAICLTSVNRNTGAVTVHGPRWVQEDMESYFERLNMTLNTRITIDAKIVLFGTTEEESKGLDLSAFAGSLENTGLAVSNNVLGGITLGAVGNRAVITESGNIASSFIGARIDGAQAFLGWLESNGTVAIENEPTITTVSGVPTTFKRTSPVIYFRYHQETTAIEGGGTSVSISTEEVERSIGSILNVNPSYDMNRNLVRAQISIDQRYLTGFAEDVNLLAAGDDIVEVPVRVPLIESILLNGEILLRDGETIIVGGQKFTSAEDLSSGITNLRNNRLLGGIFGRARASNEVMTYYTVLTVRVDETPNEQVVRL